MEPHSDSHTGWDFMQGMSVIEIKQRCIQLTIWKTFQAGNVSNRHQAEEAYKDSQTGCDFMQAMSVIEIKQRYTRLTRWMGFHAGHVSDRYRA